MASVANLAVSLTARTGQFEAAMNKSSRTLKAFGATASRFVGVAAAGVLGTSFAAAGSAAVDYADAVGKASDKTRFSSEAFSALAYGAEQSDVSMQQLTAVLVRMNRSIGDAVDGTGEQAEAFAKLGIDLSSLRKLKPEQQFVEIADRLSKVRDPAVQASAGMAILGRQFAEILPLIKRGREGLADFTKEAADAGAIVSVEQNEAAQRLNDSFTKVRQAFQGLAVKLTPLTSAIVSPINEGLAAVVAEAPGMAERATSAILRPFSAIAAAITGDMATAKRVILDGLGEIEAEVEKARPSIDAGPSFEQRRRDRMLAEAKLSVRDPARTDGLMSSIAGFEFRDGKLVNAGAIDQINSLIDKVQNRMKAAADLRRKIEQRGEVGSFAETDLRRIALQSRATPSINRPQEVRDPATEKMVELLRSYLTKAQGAVTA